MYHSAYATISQLKQLCPLHSSIAACLNQLRCANIQFLNLGSLIICPQQRLSLIHISEPTTTLCFIFLSTSPDGNTSFYDLT